MAISAAALDAMVRNGATAQMIADVVKADLEAAQATADAAVAERRRRAAEAKKAQRMALREAVKVIESPRDLRGQQRTCEDTEGLPPLPLDPPQTPPVIPNPPSSLRSEKHRARGAAEGWFADFWAAYPRRPGNPRQPAEDKFCRLVKAARDPERLAADITAGARRYAETRNGEDPQFTATAVVFLNQGRWKDDHTRPAAPSPSGGPRGGPRHSGPSFADLAFPSRSTDLFPSAPDAPRDRNPHEPSAAAADPGIPGFAGRLSQQDRDDPVRAVLDFPRAGRV